MHTSKGNVQSEYRSKSCDVISTGANSLPTRLGIFVILAVMSAVMVANCCSYDSNTPAILCMCMGGVKGHFRKLPDTVVYGWEGLKVTLDPHVARFGQ